MDNKLYRALKKNAILVLLLFRLDRPIGEMEIADFLDMDRGTIRSYLRSLAELGLVTRTHRFKGWTLTAGGRQMILGESYSLIKHLPSGEEESRVEKPPLIIGGSLSSMTTQPTRVENPSSMAKKPPSNIEDSLSNAPSHLAKVEKPPSRVENPSTKAEKPPSTIEDALSSATSHLARVEKPPSRVKNPSSKAEKPPSQPVAAASLSFKANSSYAAKPTSAEKPRSNAEHPRSGTKKPLSLARRNYRVRKKDNRTARGKARSGSLAQANLDAFASIGLAKNEFVRQICQMDHVTPDYILGQKKRLQDAVLVSAGDGVFQIGARSDYARDCRRR